MVGRQRIAALAACLALPAFVLTAALPANGQGPDTLAGRWDASAKIAGVDIPFRLDLIQRGGALRATFFDGARPTNLSAPATISDGHLHLTFPSYAATLDATVADGKLEGTYVKGRASVPITARKETGPQPAAVRNAPDIAGEWIVTGVTAKGENAWRLIVHQTGGKAEATILRIDGDTGTLNGRYVDGAFRLSHFAGERPALLEIRPQPNHQLKLTLSDGGEPAELTAVRPREAKAQGVAPADPTHFTSVADRTAAFQFDAPNLDGRKIANTDKQFRGKVVVVDVMGSWCPNCHDEAPYLQSLYQKHHKEGLEVVALDFEQTPEQVADPQRLKAFIARYGITYTVLLAGETKTVHEKLPQAVNLAAWPTTFFIGRDGRVKATHVGFTSPGSGARDVQTKTEVEKQVETLLAQRKAG
jgi:thiol-disulfide isomerase/thioredoxin